MTTPNPEVQALELRMDKRLDDIERIQQTNSEAISSLTVNISALTHDVSNLTAATKGMVDVWSAGRTIQGIVKWLSGFSFIAVVIAWYTGKIG